MKTTVKLGPLQAIVIEPAPKGGVLFTMQMGSIAVGNFAASDDQCGAILFAIEQAAEASQQARAA